MKRSFVAAGCVAVMMVSTPVLAADVGVSVTVGQPGFYGHIEIGDFPRPAVIYPQPVVIQPVPIGVVAAPLYLHVPPGHYKKWSKHCGRYNACGRPVYFVRENWYNNVYVPSYRDRHAGVDRGGRGYDGPRGDDGDRGRGHGKGHGNGKGNGKGRD